MIFLFLLSFLFFSFLLAFSAFISLTLFLDNLFLIFSFYNSAF